MFTTADVNKLKYLPDIDKKYLISIDKNIPWREICNNMSIFSKKIHLDKFDKYYYVKTHEDTDIFLIESISNNIFIDDNKKIIMFSCYLLKDFYGFIKHIDIILYDIQCTDLTNSHFIGSSFITCERWFQTYGHFKDEMFNIFDFLNRFDKKSLSDYTCIQKFNTSSDFKNYLIPRENNQNYRQITELLFAKSLNVNDLIFKCLKLKNLIIISNDYDSPTFHLFPKTATNHILSQTIIKNIDLPKNIFITRTVGLHIRRIVDNMDELNKYFENKNYTVINPEIMDYKDFINYLHNADNLFLTWGGIMVVMIYTKPSCNIYLLKSASYDGEEISIIKNLTHNYSLSNRIKIIKHSNNIINIEDIEKYIG